MAAIYELTDPQWALVADLFDPRGRRGAPSQVARRQMVEAMLFLARTGCQWRYLPERYGPWGAVWQQWRRWRANGVWARAMARLVRKIRVAHSRDAIPSMVMIDAQTVKGGRAGPTFHDNGGRGGRTIGAKRSILVEILGLPIAARVDSARPHDVTAGRDLLKANLTDLPRLQAIVADRGYRGLRNLADHRHLALDIKVPPKPLPGVPLPPPRKGKGNFTPIAPLWRVERAFAELGRWRRLSRCFEGTEASAKAWLEVASFGYMLGRL
jgi:putative transposase